MGAARGLARSAIRGARRGRGAHPCSGCPRVLSFPVLSDAPASGLLTVSNSKHALLLPTFGGFTSENGLLPAPFLPCGLQTGRLLRGRPGCRLPSAGGAFSRPLFFLCPLLSSAHALGFPLPLPLLSLSEIHRP